jgi:hypothetical protein
MSHERKAAMRTPIALLLVGCAASIADAAGMSNDAGVNARRIAWGTRAVSMGEAYAGVSDDALAIGYNAGGLGMVKNAGGVLTHAGWLLGTNHDSLALAVPVTNGVVGLGASQLTLRGTQRDTYGAEMGALQTTSGAVELGYAKGWENLGVGAVVHYTSESHATIGGRSVGADLGALVKTDTMRGMNIGMSVQNLGEGIRAGSEGAPQPTTLRVGGASTGLVGESLTLAADVSYQMIDYRTDVSVGGEYRVAAGPVGLALRAGFKWEKGSYLGGSAGGRVGLGVTVPMKGVVVGLGYALAPYGELGTVHRVSLEIGGLATAERRGR